MKTRGYWIHRNSMDMFIEVLAVYDVHPEYIKTKFRCWNVGRFSEPWLLTNKVFRAKVMKKDLHNWSRYARA